MVEFNTNIALDYFKAVLHVLSHIGSLVGWSSMEKHSRYLMFPGI